MFQNFVGNQTGLKHWIQDWVWSILALETFYSQLWSGVVHCAWQLRNLVNKNTIGSFFVVEPFIGRGVCQHTTPEGFFISGKTALVSSNSRSLSWKVPESTARGLVNGSGAKDEYVCFDFGSLKVRAGVAYLQCVCVCVASWADISKTCLQALRALEVTFQSSQLPVAAPLQRWVLLWLTYVRFKSFWRVRPAIGLALPPQASPVIQIAAP